MIGLWTTIKVKFISFNSAKITWFNFLHPAEFFYHICSNYYCFSFKILFQADDKPRKYLTAVPVLK